MTPPHTFSLTDNDYIINDLYDVILINHGDNRPGGKELVEIIRRALKLQELVKEEVKENYKGFADIQRLQEMIEESEK